MMILACLVFALQDAISRHLASEYNVIMIVMIRYWFFAAFVIVWARLQFGSVRRVAHTNQPILQIFRAVLLVAEICVMVSAFVYLGLVESLAIFTIYPLLVTAFSRPILGEYVGWRRWSAIGIGFIGVLVLLKPGFGVFSPYAVIPIISAMMFACYSLLTRYAARQDSSATSFLWTGVIGAVVISMIGPFYWEPMRVIDWGWMVLLALLAMIAHFVLIKAYELAEASQVQPFVYLHLVFGVVLGVWIFGELLSLLTIIGALIVMGSGIYAIHRTKEN